MYDFSLPEGFQCLYEEYYPKISNFLYFRLLCKRDTEDLTSEIFLKVAENNYRYDPHKTSFNTWIFTIARNTVTDFYRKRHVHQSIYDENRRIEPIAHMDIEYEIIQNEQLRVLYRALSKLEDRERSLLSLKYWGEMQNRQIAKITGIKESTVGTICLRAVSKMRREMGEEYVNI